MFMKHGFLSMHIVSKLVLTTAHRAAALTCACACIHEQVQTEEGTTITLPPLDCPLQNERDDTVDDLVKSDFLHEPG